MLILDNPSRLANLLGSINVSYVKRPLGPIDVANEINVMLEDLGGDSNELARRLPIEQDMINQFSYLRNLPEKIQGMVVWGASKHETGAIGFSVASKIALLDATEDMEKMAGTITKMPRPVTKEEIKSIVSLKKRNPDKTIDDCLLEVLNVARPTVITHHIFLSGLNPDIARSIKRFADQSGESMHEVALRTLHNVFPEKSLENVKVFSDCIRLALTKKGSDFITEYSESRNVPMQEVLNHMFGLEEMPCD